MLCVSRLVRTAQPCNASRQGVSASTQSVARVQTCTCIQCSARHTTASVMTAQPHLNHDVPHSYCVQYTVTVRGVQLLLVFETMPPPPTSIHGVRRRAARSTFTLCRTCCICCTPCDCGIFRHLVGCIFRHWSAAVYARALSCTRLTACIAKQLPIVVAIRTTVVTLVIIVVSHVWRAYDTTHV